MSLSLPINFSRRRSFAAFNIASVFIFLLFAGSALAGPLVKRQKAALSVLQSKKIGGMTVSVDRRAFKNRVVPLSRGLFRRYRVSGRKSDVHRLESLATQAREVHKLVTHWNEARGGKATSQVSKITIVPRSVSKTLIRKVGQELLVGVESGLFTGRLRTVDRYELATFWDEGKMFPLFDPFFPKVSTTRKYWSFLNPFGTVRTTAVAAMTRLGKQVEKSPLADDQNASESDLRSEMESHIASAYSSTSPVAKRLLGIVAASKAEKLRSLVERFRRNIDSQEYQERALTSMREAAYRSNWRFNFKGFKGWILMNHHRVFVGEDGQKENSDPIETTIDVENGWGVYMGFFDDVRVAVDADAVVGRVVNSLRAIALEAAFAIENRD